MTRPNNPQPLAGAHAKRRMLPLGSCRAFSLVELVVVVMIIGIMAGLAMPRFTNTVARQKVEAAARRLVVDISLTQRLARAQSVQHRVQFPIETDQYVVEYSTGPSTWAGIADPNHPTSRYLVDLSEVPYSAKIARVACGDDRAIVFDGYGTPTQVGTVKLNVGKYYQLVTVGGGNGESMAQAIDAG